MNKRKFMALALSCVMTLSMGFTTVVHAAETSFAKSNDTKVVADETTLNYPENTTVYYNGNYYKTLLEALKGAYMDTITTGTKEIHCKAGADVGHMTHGHVADNMIIHGNGAYVSSGERDLEVDTYKYNRETGNLDNTNGSYLDKDITVTVKNLDGIAAWGQRHTKHTINLNFENCKNMQRIYISGTTGDINISLDGCSFDADSEILKANKDTAIYSNANGSIKINNTKFNNIDVGINLNHKASGTQNVTITNSEFINCGQGSSSNKTYAAPVRIVAQVNAVTNLVVENSKFIYSDNITNSGNGDILIGDGRNKISSALATGTTTLSMSDTEAKVMVQKKGYYGDDGNVAKPENGVVTEVKAEDKVIPNNEDHFTVDKHDDVKIINKKDATCTEDGYTGDKVCANCGMELEKGQVIAKLGHEFKNYISDNNATCTKDGTETAKCERCDKTDTRVVENSALGHKLGEWQVTKEATIEEEGTKERACECCDYKETAVIPMIVDSDSNSDSDVNSDQNSDQNNDSDSNVNSDQNNDSDSNADKNTDDDDKVQTGDQTNTGMYLAIFGVSGLGIVLLAALRRKKVK